MNGDDWLSYWRKHLYEYARQERFISLMLERVNSWPYHNWTRPHPNPPEMNELERDIFFRYVDEILSSERGKRKS
jgi:hypothetical protein